MENKKPKYSMKAETGYFKHDLQHGQEAMDLDGQQIVVGVVQMHNTLVQAIKALQASNQVLMQVQAAMDQETGKLEITLLPGALDDLIRGNSEVMGGITINVP